MPSTTGKDIRLANRYSQENRKSAPNPLSDSTKWLRLLNAEAEMTIQQIVKWGDVRGPVGCPLHGRPGRAYGGWTCASHANILADMSKMIQLRNVPDSLHRQLKARAAMAGLSLSDFLIREARKIAEQPTPEEMAERLRQREPYHGKVSPTQVLREERDAR